MPGLTQTSLSDDPKSDTNSAIDRVRVRMTRLMHPGRAAPAGRPGPLTDSDQCADAATPVVSLAPLAADVSALEQMLEDCEKLIRQAWLVAADLNQVRRQHSRCEGVGLLAEALGTFQGLLNQARHNLRTATRAVDNIKAGLSAARG